MSGHRVMLAMMLAATVIGGLLSSPLVLVAAGNTAPSDSTKTVSGEGDFANLKVTVSQTQNLINQAITVSWTGGTPTVDTLGFQVNYLQIMQCWGDDPNGPDRTQCQFGGFASVNTPSAGSWVRTRQLTSTVVDPNETMNAPAGSQDTVYLPFWAAGRPKPTGPGTGNINEFFDSQVTNEIPLARTHGDGTGQEFFEVETAVQAAGLGCGEPVITGGSTTGRKCWLAIVPRGTKEADGSTKTGKNDFDRLQSSPLSQSNWDNRIVIPLEFLPVGQPCPIGAPERRVIGHELAAEAVSQWQPALCAGGGTLIGYTQLPDEVARSLVLDGSSPGLALLTNPVPPDETPPGPPPVYAPVGLSGLAIVFNIEHQPPSNASAADLQLNGQRFTSMKLTPRLVAKLLTQSYRLAVPYVQGDYLKNNPYGLSRDPEFLGLNPEYKGFLDVDHSVPDALVQLNGSDVTALLWSWVMADKDAREFLAGKPDPSGMVVNPHNKDLALPTSTFPRNDESCQDQIDTSTGIDIPERFCTLDAHPFANDMHDAGRSASRGDSQARTTVVDGVGKIAISQKQPRQDPGRRALLAVVDAATASRYGLPTAELLNAAGKFVAPTTESLLAGEAAMKPSAVAGVLASDPAATDPAAYPLTALSYAVTAPSTLDAAAGKDYATLLRYAGGPGQQSGIAPGQLPLGMVPLPDKLKAQTIAAAATIEAQAGKTTPNLPPPPRTTTPTAPAAAAGSPSSPSAAADPSAGKPTSSTSAQLPAANPPPRLAAGPARGSAAPASGDPGVKPPSPAQQPVARVRRTPPLPGPAWLGAVIVIILIGSASAAISPPVLHLLKTSPPVMHLLNGGIRRRLRKGVTPTEQ
jgi:hypothetical protein